MVIADAILAESRGYFSCKLTGMIEVWGGIECTINRVGDTFFDQLGLNGHYNRTTDIKAIADLGIRYLRYPILWERHQPQRNGKIDWSWADARLQELRDHKIVPIAGLVHHGSGPAFTDLLKEDFPEQLSAYAAEVAGRYPWLEYYTPVNEPLTTARFSGLYGHWYPHRNNDVSFVKILLNELKGVVLSMQEIRKVNPSAKLVQTEDLGKTYSTPLLEYQARFENHRRWLTFDILCGHFTPEHPLWSYFERLGINKSALDFFQDNPCPPDIIGVNHYITSERYLDERLERFPPWTSAGNGIHAYADVEVVRVKMDEPVGLKVLLHEMWDRFRIPVVITEAHLHCSRDEQLRWFKEVYDTAVQLQHDGIDIKAVTAWSLFGAYGWNRLLTDMPGEYETGAFDVSKGVLRETALAGLIRSLNGGRPFDNPLLKQQGWWHRNDRFYFNECTDEIQTIIQKHERPVLIIGKNGTLGQAFARLCNHRFLENVLLSRKEMNITDELSIDEAIRRYNPWAIINAAGYVKVDEAEKDPARCFLNNSFGPVQLAKKCQAGGIKLVTFSSDLVFDGEKAMPYLESDPLNPLNIYGRSKAMAEQGVLDINPGAIVIRTSAFFGPWDRYNFVDYALRELRQGQPFSAPDDITISPTYVLHLVHATLDLLIDDEDGIWHLANKGAITWFEFAREAASRAGLDKALIVPVKFNQSKAIRPVYSALDSERGNLMPSLERALGCYFAETKTPA